jgi:putative tricarboxylic transport membrane protein
MVHGLVPGPQMLTANPEFFWGLVASFWIGNFLLVVLNLPLIGIWIRMLSIPYHILFPSIIAFIAMGIYSLHRDPFDIFLVMACGLVGYIFIKLRCEAAPLLLGLILSPMLEENLRRSMLLSRGDPMIFFTRPISLLFMVMTATIVILTLVSAYRKKRTVKKAVSAPLAQHEANAGPINL